MTEDLIPCEFPVWALLPKKETGVTSFLTKYPEYDGRNITIAIFDSGVDPGAPGLQTTSEGKVKVIERYDCSGCGDVITNVIAQPKEGFLVGLTGRKLKVPDNWINPTNNYRLGIKSAFHLYPERLRERIQEDNREKYWENDHKKIMADVNRELAKFEAAHTGVQHLSENDKLEKDDIEAKIEVLNNSDKKYTDSGPVYDCVLFHDGDKWMCCVDTTEQGDLEKCPLLGEYSITHQYAPLTPSDQLNFSMNVHDDGNILELVGLCSSHGTHVASIASAHFPDSPEKNGIAPGAQIISLTIGDGRLGSMETGTALVRAMIKVMELEKIHPVQVINMSYGEHAHWSNTGRIGELMNEVVNKYGVVWVASAGNHGPALSTVGTPPDISQETIIGVGAYVSPDMMVAEYSMRQKLPGMPYSWSSRGPTIDGGFGVSVCAPGGAITSVPNFTLRNSQLMNGTSMASPHVAGAVAIVLSGLKQCSIPYSPYSVKRALENTALVLENVETFAQGSGLLQIDKVFDFLTKFHVSQENNVRFHINCGSSNSKGIYIRSKLCQTSHEYSISIEPFFKDSEDIDAKVKINFNMKLAIICKASYVSCPTHLDMANMARAFAIKIDTSGLCHGIHTTTINAYDVTCIAKGPVFRIPITVIQPQEVTGPKYVVNNNSVLFKPNTIKRHFFIVPDLATWGIIRLRSNDNNNSIGRFVIHCMQILPRQSCKSLETNKNVTVTSSAECALSFQVRGGILLEIVIAKYWANLGEITLDYTISFHGIKPNQPNFTMHAADGIHSLEVTSLQGEEILPNISLKNSVQILKPSEAKISPLTKRDVLPRGRQIYELLLLYNFHLTKATEVSPNSALLSDVLYESEFESQLWMLYDSNKQLMGCGDAYPSKYCVKLDKGDYVIRMHIRHDKKEYLDKLVDIPLLLNQKLSSAIVLDVFGSHSQAVIGGKKANIGHMLSYTTIPLYIAPLSSDKFVAKANNPAQYLTGYITYSKDELGKKVDNYPIKYVLYENSKKIMKLTDKDKTKLDEYNEALRDLKTLWLSKLDVSSVLDSLYEALLQEYPEHFAIYSSYLQNLDQMEPKRQLPSVNKENISYNSEELKKIISICDKVLQNINEEALLAYFAVKTDLRSDAIKIKSTMERQKNVLIDCLCRKGIAFCKLYVISLSTSECTEEKSITLNDVADIWKNLLKFVDPNDNKINATNVLYFASWHASVYKHYGRLLKYLQKLQEEKPVKETEEKYIEVLEVLEWKHLIRHLKRALPSKYPASYKPF